MFPLHTSQFKLIERSLEAASTRQNVIANNIANVDTPYFKRSEVNFESILQKEMEASSSGSRFHGYRTHEKHFPIGKHIAGVPEPVVETDRFSTMNNNMNNVDIDYEMSSLAKNQLRYNALIEIMNHELKMARISIDGRR